MIENVTSCRILLGAAEFVYSEKTDPRGLIVKCSLVVRYIKQQGLFHVVPSIRMVYVQSRTCESSYGSISVTYFLVLIRVMTLEKARYLVFCEIYIITMVYPGLVPAGKALAGS